MPPIITPAAAIPDFFRKSPREILLLITLGLIFNSVGFFRVFLQPKGSDYFANENNFERKNNVISP